MLLSHKAGKITLHGLHLIFSKAARVLQHRSEQLNLHSPFLMLSIVQLLHWQGKTMLHRIRPLARPLHHAPELLGLHSPLSLSKQPLHHINAQSSLASQRLQ